MDLQVRPSSEDHSSFAWSIYSSFVKDNLFSGVSGARAPDEWSEDNERHKFENYWRQSETAVISVDGELIGWMSVARNVSEIEIENLFIVNEWQNRGVSTAIFSDLIPKWMGEGLRVSARILQNATHTAQASKLAKAVGLLNVADENNSFVMQTS